MHLHARGRSQDLGTIEYYCAYVQYVHATVKMGSDSSPVSIDTEEIEQSAQSAQARRQSERLLRRKRQLRQPTG